MVIQTENLSKIYQVGRSTKQVIAVKSLNLCVPENSIYGFIGPNGAGKSTTIKLLLGLVRPTGGTASIMGHDITQESLEIRKHIGYLPQELRFYEHMTARETLRFKAHLFYKGPKARIEERIQESLELVGLGEKADRPIKGFSGGERQRLGIAQAQINEPDLLILDEPAASLDPLGRRDVLDVMKRLKQTATIFYSTHILDDVQQISDMVGIMNHGEMLAQAPLDDLLDARQHKIYTLTLEGNSNAAYTRLMRENWVIDIKITQQNSQTRWDVKVADDFIAKAELLRLVLQDKDLSVIEFTYKKFDLEDVFLDIVGAGKDG